MKNNRFGIMLDCSRNAVMTVASVKSFIDKIKIMGYNTLMLYTEDTYEVNNEPLFGHMRGRYSKEELKEIDQYCVKNDIELIPCIQTLAHFDSLVEWPVYMEIKDDKNVLLVECDRTYKLIENMISTISECFTSKTIHVGLDEAFSLGRGAYLDKHGYKERHVILANHINKVLEITKKYGFEETMMWSDMYFHIAFGSYYGGDKEIPEEIKNSVPEGVTLVYWDYGKKSEEEFSQMLAKHEKISDNIAFAGGVWKWMGFDAGNYASMGRTANAIKACRKHNVKDVFITMWGDNGAECSPNAVLPALFYIGEFNKGNENLEDIKQKFNDTFGENFDDLMLCDMYINNKIDNELEVKTLEKTMLYNDCFMGKFDSYIKEDDTEPNDYLIFRDKLIQAKNRSKNYKYIFDSYEKLCNVMAIKYNLGYRTKKAYQNRDKKALKFILKDYKKLLPRLEAFYKSFRNLWYTENKPNGFDVSDIRLGGVIQRVKNCTERLQNYLRGKIDAIPELDEPIVDYLTDLADKSQYPTSGLPFCNLYKHITTVNLL